MSLFSVYLAGIFLLSLILEITPAVLPFPTQDNRFFRKVFLLSKEPPFHQKSSLGNSTKPELSLFFHFFYFFILPIGSEKFKIFSKSY